MTPKISPPVEYMDRKPTIFGKGSIYEYASKILTIVGSDQNVTIIDRMLRKWRNEVLDRARVDKYVNT